MIKNDDCRLRGTPIGSRMCILCDLGAIEDIRHVVMQCPYHIAKGTSMYSEIDRICPNFGTLSILIGKVQEGLNIEVLYVYRI